jgi:hypothetical protein
MPDPLPPTSSTPPSRFQVHAEPEAWSVEWSWRTSRGLIALVFLPVFLAVHNHRLFSGGWLAHWRTEGTFIQVTRIILYAGVLYWIYLFLARALNRTRLTVTRDSVSVQCGPLPMPGERNQQWARGALRELSVAGKQGAGGYALYARLAETGVQQKLAGELPELEEAQWLADGLRQRLGLGSEPPSS